MQSFLEAVVDDLIDQDYNISELVIVLPNKRSGIALLNMLSRKLKKTNFSPQIYSIESFVEHVSGLTAIPHSEQLFILYTAYCKIQNKDKESFSNFCNWASMLLYDFTEIDQHLLEHRQVFDYLKAVQDINHWSSQQQTDMISSYLSFWNSIPLLYNHFCNSLFKAQKGYAGLIYRKAAEDIEYYIANTTARHIFVGFNALNKAEEHIIQAILAQDGNTIYWDIDSSFLLKKNHPAATFIKNYKEQWSYYKNNDFKWISDTYKGEKEISELAFPDDISQVKYIGHILSSFSAERLTKTAVILADETLLIPLLSALPKNIAALNVTMGIPLLKTPIASFFEYLFRMHKNKREQGFYYKDVLTILNQSQTKLLLADTAHNIISYLTATNTVYITYKTLIGLESDNPSLSFLFGDWKIDIAETIENCLGIINRLQKKLQEKKEVVALEYAYGFYTIFNQLSLLHTRYNYLDSFETLYYFYRDALRTETVDLKGDPYKGLQIMGILESRLLDFDHIIMASVNEGLIPSGKTQNSYLPFDLRLAHNLPTFKEKDMVYAYHFYHVLQRAKTAHFCYTASSDGLGAVSYTHLTLPTKRIV